MRPDGSGAGPLVAVLPPVPALLPEHAGLVDPVAELRAACREALAALLEGARCVVVLHDPLDPADRDRGATEPVGSRVARALLDEAGWAGETRSCTPAAPDPPGDAVLLVMASGSACRGEKAPGHLDARSFAFDDAVQAALASADPARLGALDADLGDVLLAAGVRCLHRLGDLLGARSRRAGRPPEGEVRWAGDPYGVQYWVAVLQLGAPTPD